MANKKAAAEALLDAHVRFVVDALDGAALKTIVEEEIDEAFVNMKKLRLGDVSTRTSVKATARAFVSNVELADRAGDVVVDIARTLQAHAVHDRTTLGNVVPDDLFERGLDRVLAMKPLHEKLARTIISSPLYAAFASDLLYGGIKGYLAQSAVTLNIPGAQSVMKFGRAMLSKATPDLEASIEEGLKKYIARVIEASAGSNVDFLLSDEALAMFRDSAGQVWERMKVLHIGDFREAIRAADVETFARIAFEGWLQLRRSRYFRTLLDAAVDRFFDLYEDEPLTKLLDDFGITREVLLAEILRHLPHAVGALKKKKMLEPLVRRRLRAFYQSGVVEKVLDDHFAQSE
jgi:hypothetical protein